MQSIKALRAEVKLARDFISAVYWCNDSVPNFYRCFVEFDVGCFDAGSAERVGISIPDSISAAVIKRRAEFVAGRYAASLVLDALGYQQNEILIGEFRAPIWPQGIVGSISHTTSVAMCAARHTNQKAFLGCDIEAWIDQRTAFDIEDRIIDSVEQRLLSNAGLAKEQSLTIAFSAKECLFKAIFPVLQSYIDFDAVKIVEVINDSQTLALEVTQSGLPTCLYEQKYHCDFQVWEEYCFTEVQGIFSDV